MLYQGVFNFSSITDLFFEAIWKIKNKKLKPPTRPNFSQNLDENLKIYLVWPKLHMDAKIDNKLSFMLNSTEHEIYSAQINVERQQCYPAYKWIGILTFMSRIKSMLTWIEHEKVL